MAQNILRRVNLEVRAETRVGIRCVPTPSDPNETCIVSANVTFSSINFKNIIAEMFCYHMRRGGGSIRTNLLVLKRYEDSKAATV
jgi:hypothetical protein